MEFEISRHAHRRIKQRCGIGKKAHYRFVKNAVDNGKPLEEIPVPLKRWIEHQKAGRPSWERVWHDCLFLFSDVNDVLITVIKIPYRVSRVLH